MVPAGAKMADIGTDHGHLPIWLVQSGKIRHAVAMDVGEGPLSRAQHAIRQCHLTKHIETRLSDGAANLMPGEVDTIVIAGMGGALIQKIIHISHVRDLHFLRAILFQIQKTVKGRPQLPGQLGIHKLRKQNRRCAAVLQ